MIAPAIAQLNPVGFMHANDFGGVSRGNLGSAPGQLLTRIDARDFAGWATEFPNAFTHVVHGIVVEVQDEDLATQELFEIVGYDGLDFDSPDLTRQILGVTGLQSPSGTGPMRFTANVTFGTPARADATASTFWGVGFPAVTGAGYPADGMSAAIYLGHEPGPTFTRYDLPGPRPIANGGYGLEVDATGTANYLSPRQLMLDLLAPTAGGMVTAVTNQTTLPSSNLAPGTTSMFSAYHPDARDTPFNAGRADDPGFVLIDQRLAGDSVAFVIGIAFNPIYLPLIGISPGSDGTLCLHPALIIPAATVTADGSGVASFTLSLNTVQRAALFDGDVFWTAIGLDDGTMIRGGPCARQQF